jgi:3-oxoadipate enol-lactonase
MSYLQIAPHSINLYYEDHGRVDSYPLILIHPIGGNVLIWEYEISLLLKNGFRIIAYEIRGHHRTNMGNSNAYAMQDLVDDLGALLTHLNIHKCTIIGHSIGGIIGSIYAAQNPEKVDGLVLINSSPKKFQDFDLEKHFKTRAIAISRGIEALAEHKLQSLDESKDLVKEKQYSDFFRDVFTKTSVDGFVAATVALYSIPEDAAKQLRISGCRVLAIVGSDDSAFMRLSKETKEMMPEMELKVIEGSDHWMIIEKPNEMYDILMGFLGKIIGVSKS